MNASVPKQTVYFPKGSVVLNAALACLEDEPAIKKMMLDYLGNNLSLSEDLLTQREKTILLEGALKLFEKKDISINRRLYKWIFGGDIDSEIVINEDNQKGFNLLLDALKSLFKGKPSDAQEAIQPIKIMQNIFIEHEELCKPILKSLAVSFIVYYYDAFQGQQFGEEVSIQAEKLIDNINDYFQIVLDSFKAEIVNSNKLDKMKIMRMFKFIAQKFLVKETKNISRMSNYHRSTILGILSQMLGVNLDKVHELNPADFSVVRFGSQTLNLLLTPLTELTAPNNDVFLEVCADETFVGTVAMCIDSVARLLKAYSKDHDSVDLSPCHYTIQDLLNFVISSFEYTQILQPLQEGEIPEWLLQTFQGINSKNPVIAEICMEACVRILELFTRLKPETAEQTANKIWDRLKTQVLSPDLKDKIGFDLLKTLVVLSFARLDTGESRKIVRYMLLLARYALPLIDEYIEGELANPNVELNVVCFRECIKLWQLTQDNSGSDAEAIRERLCFRLLPFVDHENPLLRYSAKNWLTLASSKFRNVLDVIFTSLLSKTEWVFANPSNSSRLIGPYYNSEYPTQEVTRSIKHLKDILIVIGDVFCSYMVKNKTSPCLSNLIPRLGERKLSPDENNTYLDLLAVICIRYIQGNWKDESDPFHMKNLSVKATASEFLEMILSKIPDKKVSGRISFHLLDSLALVLKQAVEKDESSILIQILSVLNVIMFYNKFQTDKDWQDMYMKFVQQVEFLNTLIQGLSSKHLYIVIEFKEFICRLITVVSESMKHPQLTEIVNRLIKGYYDLISKNNARVFKTRTYAESNVSTVSLQTNPAFSLIANMVEKDQDERRFEEIDDDFLETLLEGLDFCLKTFVGNDNIISSDHKKTEEPSIFMSIITLGIKSTPKDETFFKNHENVGKSILGDLRSQLDAFMTCWAIDQDLMRCVNFNDFGCLGFDTEETRPYIKKVDVNSFPKINQKIIRIIRPFGKRFMPKLIEELLRYWLQLFDKPDFQENQKVTRNLRTLMNIICDSMLNPIDLIAAFCKTEAVKAIKDSNGGSRRRLAKATADKPIELNMPNSRQEARILFFLYNFLKYMKIDFNVKIEERVSQYLAIWVEVIQLLKAFGESVSPNTSFWVVEILVLLANKFTVSTMPDDLASDVHKVFMEETSFISNYAALKYNLSFREAFLKQDTALNPLPPTIAEFYWTKSARTSKNDQKLMILAELTRQNFTKDRDLKNKYRFQCFKVLTFIMRSSFITGAKSDKLSLRIRGILDNIFPIMYARDAENLQFVECASEVIHECVVQNQNKVVVRDLQKDIMEVFGITQFFKCSSNTLKYWARIIDTVASLSKVDVLEEYLKNVNFSSMFSSRSSEDKTRISSLERVCFIIYAGDIDKYMSKTKIKSLMDKIREVLKEENPNPRLQILIFFILRVLILRLSPSHLSELFRNIWPILLTLLIEVFRPRQMDPKNLVQLMDRKSSLDLCVILAGLKLLELLSICNVDLGFANEQILYN